MVMTTAEMDRLDELEARWKKADDLDVEALTEKELYEYEILAARHFDEIVWPKHERRRHDRKRLAEQATNQE